MLVDRNSLDGLVLHVYIPDLHGEVITREDISAIGGETNVGYRGNYLREEGTGGWVFFLFEYYVQDMLLALSFHQYQKLKAYTSHVDRKARFLSYQPAL